MLIHYTLFFYIFPETCKIVLDSNNKDYTVCINQLKINGCQQEQ